MTKTKKKGSTNYSRMTKAQLLESIAENNDHLNKKDKELEQLQVKLKQKNQQMKELHQELVKIKRVQKNSKVEKQNLIEKLQRSEEQAPDLIKKLEKQLTESNRKRKSLKREAQKLNKKICELEEELSAQEKSKYRLSEDIAAPRTAFRIDLYQRQGDYHGRIIHLLTKNEKKFTGVDQAAISEFIIKHIKIKPLEGKEILSSIPLEGLDRSEDKEISGVSPLQEIQVQAELFEKIRFQQRERYLDAMQPLDAGMQFSVHTCLNFPVVPNETNMDIDSIAYAVHVVAMDESEKKVVAHNSVADILSSGEVRYENRIDMPGLDPGKYYIKLYTIAPFAKIEANKQVELNVEA